MLVLFICCSQDSVGYLRRLLLSNGSVKTHLNRETAFYKVRVVNLATQRRGKYVATLLHNAAVNTSLRRYATLR
jgi:hypothetical protein